MCMHISLYIYTYIHTYIQIIRRGAAPDSAHLRGDVALAGSSVIIVISNGTIYFILYYALYT